MLVLNFFIFYLLTSIFSIVGKIFFSIFFLINSIAVYFINTYGVIIDESMIGNVLNTNFEESSSFFSSKLVFYFIILGLVPTFFVWRVKIIKESLRKIFITASLSLLTIAVIALANASNWLWIDDNSKTLGGLAMPWCYTVNISLFYTHQYQENKKEILLPNATISNTKKSVVVLVIGESARRQNFSLYGYAKNTNPILSKTNYVFHYNANSCATYTTAGLKCILEHTNTDELYEILPNYLYRNDVEVVWRTANWGEPPIHIKNYQNKEYLTKNCTGPNCNYDEVLLNGLKEQILASKKNKVLIVLHTSTSHGPNYSNRYPPQFATFTPVCKTVELANCTQNELLNAYDNTIVYTDYILSQVIENLKQLSEFNSTMLFVSDHGESLGEKNLYMHGVPMSFAPKEQYEIPFIVWVSDSTKTLKPLNDITQGHVFHSVLNFLSVQSPIYNEQLNIFK
jgi:lipid A ethanolaminephosphotransferase